MNAALSPSRLARLLPKTMSSSSRPLLIILGGPPGSGKTTLGRRLADDMRLPFVHKDGIKEALFDRLGGGDSLEQSRALGRASYDVLYYFVETLLRADCSHIVESNFDAAFASPVFRGLMQRYPRVSACQVLCHADGETLLRRVLARSVSGERHPAHHDLKVHRQAPDLLRQGRLPPLNIDGPVIAADTTDFARFDYEGLLSALRGAAEEAMDLTRNKGTS